LIDPDQGNGSIAKNLFVLDRPKTLWTADSIYSHNIEHPADLKAAWRVMRRFECEGG
jgi:hypothetical protein